MIALRGGTADSGNIGGNHSHEVQVVANVGEDTILRYAGRRETSARC